MISRCREAIEKDKQWHHWVLRGKEKTKKHFRMQLARYTANSACRTRGNKANVSFY